jgi:hypothetical protein
MQWEYKIIKQWMEEYEMQPLGDKGWELVDILRPYLDSVPQYIFKRPKEEKMAYQYQQLVTEVLMPPMSKEPPCTCIRMEGMLVAGALCPKHDA